MGAEAAFGLVETCRDLQGPQIVILVVVTIIKSIFPGDWIGRPGTSGRNQQPVVPIAVFQVFYKGEIKYTPQIRFQQLPVGNPGGLSQTWQDDRFDLFECPGEIILFFLVILPDMDGRGQQGQDQPE